MARSAINRYMINSSGPDGIFAALTASNDANFGTIAVSDAGQISLTGVTSAEIRGEVSHVDSGGDGSFSYNSGTGVFTYTGPSAAEVRAHFSVSQSDADALSTLAYQDGVFTFNGLGADEIRAQVSVTDAGGDGSCAYNASTGVITYTGPSSAEVRAHLSGTANECTFDANTGAIGLPDDVTITGNLTVMGDNVIMNTSTLEVEDVLVRVAKGANALAAGQGIEIGDDLASMKLNAGLRWESSTSLEIKGAGAGLFIDSAEVLDKDQLKARVKLEAGCLTAVDTGDLSEGSNLYYTDARVQSYLTADGQGLEMSNAGQFSLELDGSTMTKAASGLKITDLGVDSAQCANDMVISRMIADGAIDSLDYLSQDVKDALHQVQRVKHWIASDGSNNEFTIGGNAVKTADADVQVFLDGVLLVQSAQNDARDWYWKENSEGSIIVMEFALDGSEKLQLRGSDA